MCDLEWKLPAGLRHILTLHEARAALDLLKTSYAATHLFHGSVNPTTAGKHSHLQNHSSQKKKAHNLAFKTLLPFIEDLDAAAAAEQLQLDILPIQIKVGCHAGPYLRQEPCRSIGQERWQSSQVPRQIREAAEDPFLQEITSSSGPAAYYKENRLSGLYKKVDHLTLFLRWTAGNQNPFGALKLLQTSEMCFMHCNLSVDVLIKRLKRGCNEWRDGGQLELQV